MLALPRPALSSQLPRPTRTTGPGRSPSPGEPPRRRTDRFGKRAAGRGHAVASLGPAVNNHQNRSPAGRCQFCPYTHRPERCPVLEDYFELQRRADSAPASRSASPTDEPRPYPAAISDATPPPAMLPAEPEVQGFPNAETPGDSSPPPTTSVPPGSGQDSTYAAEAALLPDARPPNEQAVAPPGGSTVLEDTPRPTGAAATAPVLGALRPPLPGMAPPQWPPPPASGRWAYHLDPGPFAPNILQRTPTFDPGPARPPPGFHHRPGPRVSSDACAVRESVSTANPSPLIDARRD